MNLSIDVARRIVEASKQRARELRSTVSIAIVDGGGHLVLFERMMSPYGWATSNISIAKACTAVMFNQSTDAVAQWGASIPGFASSLATMTQGKFIMAAGGWPIRAGGVTIGGIGVSGGNAPGRDDEIARAGLAILEMQAPPVPARPFSQAPAAQPPFRPSHSMQPAPSYPTSPPMPAPGDMNISQSVPASNMGVPQHIPISTQNLVFDQPEQEAPSQEPISDQPDAGNDHQSGGQP